MLKIKIYQAEFKLKNSFNLKMVTTWPKDFPGLGTSAKRLADKINKASKGQINIKVYGSGELVPAYESFDAVRNGVADMCHDSPYYWISKQSCYSFFLNSSIWIEFIGANLLAFTWRRSRIME